VTSLSYIWGGYDDNLTYIKSAIDPSSNWFPADSNGLPYDKPGLLQPHMTVTSADGVRRNSSGFNITLQPEPEWNNKGNGPFGEIISGLDLLKKIKMEYGPYSDSSKVVIADCGTLDS